MAGRDSNRASMNWPRLPVSIRVRPSTSVPRRPRRCRPTRSRLAHPAQAGGPGVRGQLHEQRLQPGGQLAQLVVHLAERARVGRGVPRDPGRRARRVVPVGQHLPVVQRHLQGRLAGHHPQPVRAQVQRPDHLGPEHARDVGGGGGPAAGRDLLGDAASAGPLAGLDHQRGQARAGQQGAGGQAVVTGADHDDVPARRGGHADGHSLSDYWSFKRLDLAKVWLACLEKSMNWGNPGQVTT